MKRTITKSFFLFVLCLPLIGNAQTIEKLEAKGAHAQFSGDESSILITKPNYSTIEKFDILSKSQILLEEGRGVAYNSFIDGNIIFIKNKDKKATSIDINTGIKKIISDVKSPKIAAKLATMKLGKNTSNMAIDVIPTLMIDGFIVVYSNGTQKEFNPRGKKTYIDVSLSPDGTKVLYTSVKGTEILKLTDYSIIPLGSFESAKWVDNNKIIYMSTIDDGNAVLESDVFMFNISERTKNNLTSNFDDIAMFPSASKDGSKVLFNNDKEEIFLITLNR